MSPASFSKTTAPASQKSNWSPGRRFSRYSASQRDQRGHLLCELLVLWRVAAPLNRCLPALREATAVTVQAASVNQSAVSERDRSGGKSDTSDNRRVATAYIPMGNTRLQNKGV